MSEPIRPLDLDFLDLDSSLELDDEFAIANSEIANSEREGELDLDRHPEAVFAPADLSEPPARLTTLSVPRATTPTEVPTLTNSPRCAPSPHALSNDTAPPASPSASRGPSPRDASEAKSRVRPVSPSRSRSVRVDAWSTPAPANWGRAKRTVRQVRAKGTGRGRTARGLPKAPSSDWALPF